MFVICLTREDLIGCPANTSKGGITNNGFLNLKIATLG